MSTSEHPEEVPTEGRGQRGSSALEYMLIAVALLVGIVVALYQVGDTTEDHVEQIEEMLAPDKPKAEG